MDIHQIINSDNVAELVSEDELKKIGNSVVEWYYVDKQSRRDWETKYEKALKLAAQVVEAKTSPWPGAANIKYPLLTTACVQFSARAYPALIPGTDVVKCKTTGFDADGEKEARALRVSKHMSYQVLEEMDEWEEDMDRLLIMLPITGTEFKKTYFDKSKGRNVSEHVLSKDLIVNYWAKSLEDAQRKTHVISLTKNEVRERILRGIFLDVKLGNPEVASENNIKDTIQGTTQPHDDSAPYEMLECHCFWDLDEDDYEEPYIVTVDKASRKVLRIVARFDADGVDLVVKGSTPTVIGVKPVEYFTKFTFIPSLDGGFYDTGWGMLLGPINETVNTTINQLLDAGKLSNMQSGFLSRGIRIRGGNSKFEPGEWKVVDTTGDDLRKGVFALPVREPSQTLFQLLGMMNESGQKLANVVDILMGENPGQNQPATTTLAVIEQGLKVFTAVYKRLYRALKREYQKLYRLNKIYLDDKVYFTILDPGDEKTASVMRMDYRGDPTDVQPAADPFVVSDAQRLAKAQALVTSIHEGSPADPIQVWTRYYEAMNIAGIERFMPQQMPPPPVDPKIQEKQMDIQFKSTVEQIAAKQKDNEQSIAQQRLQLDQDRVKLEAMVADANTRNASTKTMIDQYNAETNRLKIQPDIVNSDQSKLEIAKISEANKRDIAIINAESQERIAQFNARVQLLIKAHEAKIQGLPGHAQELSQGMNDLVSSMSNQNPP